MAMDDTLKKLVGFNYRATYFKQTAEDMLDDSVTTRNIVRLQNVKDNFTNEPREDIVKCKNLINILREYYESLTLIKNIKMGYRELRLVSYNIPIKDFQFCKYILSILEHKWYPSYINGLIYCLLKNWNYFESDIQAIIKETLISHVISPHHANIVSYLSDNGAYQLGYKLYKENRSIYDCCRMFNLSSNKVSYSYFTGVIKGFYETNINVDYTELCQILRCHNNTQIDKIVLSRLIVNQYKRQNISPQLFDLVIERIGSPYIDSQWAIPSIATKEESYIITSAKKIICNIISSKIINIFFNSLCHDSLRLEFWLKHTDKIQDFKVYGSELSQNTLLSKLDCVIINSKFNLISGKSDNCALVMYINNYVVVEFSTGGALYVYQIGSKYNNIIFNKKIEKIDDLKLPYMSQLINSSYDYLYMNMEGRMVHSGNWQYRLDRWFSKMIDK